MCNLWLLQFPSNNSFSWNFVEMIKHLGTNSTGNVFSITEVYFIPFQAEIWNASLNAHPVFQCVCFTRAHISPWTDDSMHFNPA